MKIPCLIPITEIEFNGETMILLDFAYAILSLSSTNLMYQFCSQQSEAAD